MDIARELEVKWAALLEKQGLAKELSITTLRGAIAFLPATLDDYGVIVYADKRAMFNIDVALKKATSELCDKVLQQYTASECDFVKTWRHVSENTGTDPSFRPVLSAQLHRRVGLLWTLRHIYDWTAVKTAVPARHWGLLRAIVAATDEFTNLCSSAGRHAVMYMFIEAALFAIAGLME